MTKDNETPESAALKPRRRWLSFGLRAFLVFALLAGCFAGLVGYQVNLARQEVHAIAKLKERNGSSLNLIFFNPYKEDDPGEMEMFFAGGPEWLTNLLGVDLFRATKAMTCYAPGNSFRYESDEHGELVIRRDYKRGVDDEQAAWIAKLTQLRYLQIEASPIGDVGAARLASLQELETLNLNTTAISDKAIESIAQLSNLQELDISRTAVTDRSLELLADCKTLKKLKVEITKVTEAGVARFREQLPECEVEQ